MAKPPFEKDFQTYLLKRLRKLKPSFWVKINDRSSSGILDVWGFYNGHGIVIELKTKTEETAQQKQVAKKLSRAGAKTYVATHQNFEAVLELIESLPSRAPTEKRTSHKERKSDSEAACSICPICLLELKMEKVLFGTMLSLCRHGKLRPIINPLCLPLIAFGTNQNEAK